MTRKHVFLASLLLASTFALGQAGKIRLTNDSTLRGYLRMYRSSKDGSSGIEYWATKTDKNPQKIPMTDVSVYTLGGKTFKVFHDYQPFAAEDIYFEMIESRLISGGKVNLYLIADYKGSVAKAAAVGGLVGSLIFVALNGEPDLYILESNNGYLRAIPSGKEALRESLKDFFPDRYLDRWEQENGEIKYRKVSKLVELYNSK